MDINRNPPAEEVRQLVLQVRQQDTKPEKAELYNKTEGPTEDAGTAEAASTPEQIRTKVLEEIVKHAGDRNLKTTVRNLDELVRKVVNPLIEARNGLPEILTSAKFEELKDRLIRQSDLYQQLLAHVRSHFRVEKVGVQIARDLKITSYNAFNNDVNSGPINQGESYEQIVAGKPFAHELQNVWPNILAFTPEDKEKSKEKLKIQKETSGRALKSLAAWTGMKPDFIVLGMVNMSECNFASLSGTPKILYTMSLAGCLGMAALVNNKIVLAHWTPNQLPSKALDTRVREISESGQLDGLTIHLGGELAKSDVPYMNDMRKRLKSLGATLVLHDGRSLAINDKGEVLTNFEI